MLFPFSLKLLPDSSLGLCVDDVDPNDVRLPESLNPVNSLDEIIKFESDSQKD